MDLKTLRASSRKALARNVRTVLSAGARRGSTRAVMGKVASEIANALQASGDAKDGLYGSRYYGTSARAGEVVSGYGEYTRSTSNADKAAYVVWKNFQQGKTLELGCAMGFCVEALREQGFDAHGVDISNFAIENANADVRSYLRQVDAGEGLPFADGEFDVVMAFEMLEHVDPSQVAHVLQEMRRVSGGYVVATIPSFGSNRNGDDGWFDGKVRWERLEHYKSLGPDYNGPVPFDDLMRDDDGHPIEGHLTIASFEWWTQQFEAAGFERCDEVVQRMYIDLHRFGLAGSWNPYVFKVPGVAAPAAELRSPDQVRDVETAWHLDVAA